MSKQASDFRANTKHRMIAELAESGLTQRETFATLKPLVIDQIDPMIFTRNPDRSIGETQRMPKPISSQLIELKNQISRVWVELGKSAEGSGFGSDEIDVPTDEIPAEEPVSEEPKADDTDRCFTRSILDELRYFQRRVREVRAFCIQRASEFKETIDEISNRPVEQGGKLIMAGIPADLLLLSMTMHWKPDMRQKAGIDSFDFNVEGKMKAHPEFLRVSQWVMKNRGIDPNGTITDSEGNENPIHALFGFALILVENRVPMMLIGPPGTGKSFLAKQVADYLRISYGETPMSAGASRSDLLGRHTISQENPFITSEFEGKYGGGGMFNFEEIDRGDPAVVITLNNALAGKRLFNSINGEEIVRHPDFIAVATANTFGLGATREATAAVRMEAATADRFRMGRMFVPMDEDLEGKILFQHYNAIHGTNFS